MSPAVSEVFMAKQERGSASATVKIDPELLRKAKQVLLLDGGKLSDYIDKFIRGGIERDYGRVMKKIREEGGR